MAVSLHCSTKESTVKINKVNISKLYKWCCTPNSLPHSESTLRCLQKAWVPVWKNITYPGDPTGGRRVGFRLLRWHWDINSILSSFLVPLTRFYGSVLCNKEYQSSRKALIIIMEDKIIQLFFIQHRPSTQAEVRRPDNLWSCTQCRFSTGNGQK